MSAENVSSGGEGGEDPPAIFCREILTELFQFYSMMKLQGTKQSKLGHLLD